MDKDQDRNAEADEEAGGLSPLFHPAMGRIRVAYVLRPNFGPPRIRALRLLNRPPSLDQAAGRFPVRFDQGGPHAADRSTRSIGTLLPIALCGRCSLYNKV